MGRHPIVEADYRQLLALDLPWRELYGRTVLVTGASGFIGGHLVDFLSFINESDPSAHIRVIGLARNREKLQQRLPWLMGDSGLESRIADVCSEYTDMPACDLIVHAASPASPTSYLDRPVDTMLANFQGCLRLLEFAREHTTKVLFLSSGTVYGAQTGSGIEISENDFGGLDTLDPRACYGEGKRAAESLCAAYHRQYGVSFVIARISHTYGPGMNLNDGRVVTDLLRDALAGRDLELRADGAESRPFCYVSDLLAGLWYVIFKGRLGEAYNVGIEEETSIFELAAQISALRDDLKLRIFGYAKNSIPPAARLSGHFSLVKLRDLGWVPLTNLSSGIARTYRSYVQQDIFSAVATNACSHRAR